MNRFFTFPIVLLSLVSFAQSSGRIEKLVTGDRTQVDKVEQLDVSTITYVPSIFAKEFVAENKATLNELTITKVYYVYTLYRLNPSFDQRALDRKRFHKLESIINGITSDPFIEWEILEQTGCKDYTEGKDYFHGFILVHRPVMTEEERMDEVNAIINFFENPTDEFVSKDLDLVAKQLSDSICDCEFEKLKNKGGEEKLPDLRAEFKEGEYALYKYLQKNLKNSEEVFLKRTDEWIDTKFEVDEYGRIGKIEFMQNYPRYLQDEITMAIRTMPDWHPAVKNEKTVSSTVNLQIRVSYSGTVKGMYTRDFQKPRFQENDMPVEIKDATTEFNLMVDQEAVVLKATVVYKGLDQVPLDQKVALVMDVTGSMSSNIAAMKKWINANHQRMPFTSFTFFNDGDGKPSKKKKVGSTGGIYFTKDHNEMKETMKNAMLGGGGGERPENDVEAILHALNNDPDCDVILLIGDNYSEVRDLSLLNKVTKPVYVLPCAAPRAIRHDYLNIARRSGGLLIHDGKIVEVNHVQKGEKFYCNGAEYKFDGRDFKLKSTD